MSTTPPQFPKSEPYRSGAPGVDLGLLHAALRKLKAYPITESRYLCNEIKFAGEDIYEDEDEDCPRSRALIRYIGHQLEPRPEFIPNTLSTWMAENGWPDRPGSTGVACLEDTRAAQIAWAEDLIKTIQEQAS